MNWPGSSTSRATMANRIELAVWRRLRSRRRRYTVVVMNMLTARPRTCPICARIGMKICLAIDRLERTCPTFRV